MKDQIRKIKDSVWKGLGIGLIVPAILLTLTWYVIQQVKVVHKPDLFYIACIAVNAYLMQVFFKHNKERIGKGVLSATFLWAFAFFIYKTSQ